MGGLREPLARNGRSGAGVCSRFPSTQFSLIARPLLYLAPMSGGWHEVCHIRPTQPRTRGIRSHAEAGLGARGQESQCTELSNSFAPPVPVISPGELLEESQMEASRLRQKAEELVKGGELLPPPSPSLASFDHLAELTGTRGLGCRLSFSRLLSL